MICLLTATRPRRAVSFFLYIHLGMNPPFDIPLLSWDSCWLCLSITPCLPLLVSGLYFLLSHPPHSSISSGFLSRLLPSPLIWTLLNAQHLAHLSVVSVQFLPENSLILTASLVTCRFLMMLISNTLVLYYHFRRYSTEEILTETRSHKHRHW